MRTDEFVGNQLHGFRRRTVGNKDDHGSEHDA